MGNHSPQCGTLWHVARISWIHARDTGGLLRQITAIAVASSTRGSSVDNSTVTRTLLAEALGHRATGCENGHRGPTGTGTCGHCGAPAGTTP